MGNTHSIKKINFEDMQTVIKNLETYLLINTLPLNEQQCLIRGTVSCEQEETTINKYIRENKGLKIIIYGKNCNDIKPQEKAQQLYNLGFYNIFIYAIANFVYEDFFNNLNEDFFFEKQNLEKLTHNRRKIEDIYNTHLISTFAPAIGDAMI